MPAKVANPLKQFQFQIFIPGMNPFLAQKVKLPDDESDVTEHGDAGYLVKTPGLAKLGMLTVEKIQSAGVLDNAISTWRRLIFNYQTSLAALPSAIKRTIVIVQYAPDGISVVNRYMYDGCWPQKVNGIDLDRKGSDNTVETIDFCVDELVPTL